MTVQNILEYAYAYCLNNGLTDECIELSNLTATWNYQNFKYEPLDNIFMIKLPLSIGSCPRNRDLINREAALRESYKITIDGDTFDVVQVETLMCLPPATLISCKDCNYSKCWYKEGTR